MPDWTTLLPELTSNLTHLPMTKSRRHQQITLPVEVNLPSNTKVTVTTSYPEGNQRLGIDGEVLTAMVISSLQDPQGAEGDRVYLDATLAKLLGNLGFAKNTSLPYILQRLSKTEYQIGILTSDAHQQQPHFTAGQFIQHLGIPFFEWSAEMIETLDDLRHRTSFSDFNHVYHATLKHPGARRIYRHICRNGVDDMPVSQLANILGIYTAPDATADHNIVWASVPDWGKLHRAFDRAMEELVERGFLRYVGYTGSGEARSVYFDVETRYC